MMCLGASKVLGVIWKFTSLSSRIFSWIISIMAPSSSFSLLILFGLPIAWMLDILHWSSKLLNFLPRCPSLSLFFLSRRLSLSHNLSLLLCIEFGSEALRNCMELLCEWWSGCGTSGTVVFIRGDPAGQCHKCPQQSVSVRLSVWSIFSEKNLPVFFSGVSAWMPAF